MAILGLAGGYSWWRGSALAAPVLVLCALTLFLTLAKPSWLAPLNRVLDEASSLLKFDIRADEDANAKNRERMKSKHCALHLDRMRSFLTVWKSFSTNC